LDRIIVQPSAIPLDTDVLNTNRNPMIALGWLLQSVMGTSTGAVGLACTPTVPASLTVNVGAGALWSLEEIDQNAYGSLSADTSPLMKMGINKEAAGTNFTLTAPATSGRSINYLIEASFLEQDGTPVVLPFVNPSNPATPFSGPNNSGAAQNTVRAETVQLQLKAGVAANTGTQTTPATDVGFVPLYVITVNFGQSTITAGGITVAPGAPFLPLTLPNVLVQGGTVGSVRNLAMSVASASASATMTADEIIVETALAGLSYRLGSFNKTLNLATTGVGGMDSGAAPDSGYVAIYAIFNPTTGTAALLATNATTTVAPSIYGGANMPAGFTASALVSVWPTNSSGEFSPAEQADRDILFTLINVVATADVISAFQEFSIGAAVPKNAKKISGTLGAETTASPAFVTTEIASTVSGYGAQFVNSTIPSAGLTTPFSGLRIVTPQAIFLLTSDTGSGAGTPQFIVNISGYSI